jgi:hypothetical protein
LVFVGITPKLSFGLYNKQDYLFAVKSWREYPPPPPNFLPSKYIWTPGTPVHRGPRIHTFWHGITEGVKIRQTKDP